MSSEAAPVRAADVYVVVGDPDGHVHTYPDETRAGMLAVGFVGANLDGALFALTAEEWAAKRPGIERLLARGGAGRVIEHP